MKGMTDEQVLEFNEGIIEEFRANQGMCGGRFEGNPMLLMTVTGARTGRRITTPLTYHAYDDDYIVMASAGGDPRHPAWYFNLVAHPDVVLEVGTERFEATAVQTRGDERTRVFESMVAAMPRFGDYQAGVEREIPIFRLERKPVQAQQGAEPVTRSESPGR
jgi:deazaflavin-dependent oxidoreductase (nitroreductase family)